MDTTVRLKKELEQKPIGSDVAFTTHKAVGYRSMAEQSNVAARSEAIYTLFSLAKPHIYQNDRIVGSLRMRFDDPNEAELQAAKALVENYPERDFFTNCDHFSPQYRDVLKEGLPALYARIKTSLAAHQNDPQKAAYLNGMLRSLDGFIRLIQNHLTSAQALKNDPAYPYAAEICENLEGILAHPPATFAESLQLVWMIHTAFHLELRYAMALGRMDQYLYPYYEADIKAGRITPETAKEMLENAFIKLYEYQILFGGDDVENIAVGGTAADGSCDINELSYLILRAVDKCHIPGPNLSARITHHTPDDFLDECLQTIGTGLGYPALMNDEVNLKALSYYGYSKEDVHDYIMVGCIENFIAGKQPPWSDGRFNTPKYLEYLLNDGKAIYGDHGIGEFGSETVLNTGSVDTIDSMEELMRRYEKQISHGIAEYVRNFNARNSDLNLAERVQPFLSIFCADCIGRGEDICLGGAIYPSVHGIAIMGNGTVCDSLAAIEKVVFIDQACTLSELVDALKADFVGYEALQAKLLDAPKYGNDDDFADKYAVWMTEFVCRETMKHRTHDGGYYYVGMAANVSNVSYGVVTAATPDGRKRGTPISDAASPTFGRDTLGPTAAVCSITKPDYSKVSCGSVINQKFSPAMFSDEHRDKLAALIRVYFARGGQEVQINATSREVLKAAMEHPEQYGNLVVRVSGFSALFTRLERSVQEDILARTEHSA